MSVDQVKSLESAALQEIRQARTPRTWNCCGSNIWAAKGTSP